jgi:N-methylhydantoinase A/oxoprolinase/acetone carboxylase beta subunit
MQSNGGIISAEKAAAHPVRTVLSGPAGGVLGAAYAASLAGMEKIITFDMGGTSTDVAQISGETQVTTESHVAGFPISVPMLEIHTVGAGGGSIARFDKGAALRVGPESAGADPGPICYGRGELPTVTDAHAALGHFGGRGLLNGGFDLQLERTHRELDKRKGSFRTVEAFAQGILGVSNAVIERAVRRISIERGHDPRDYTLVAFGGAGGLHACDLAAALEMRGVLLPVFAGGLSALGILRADVVRDFSRTVLLPVRDPLHALREAQHTQRKLRSDADGFLRGEGFAENQRCFEYRFDVRYVGQAYDLGVPARADFVTAFHQAHELAYGHADPHRPVEIVNVRCRATGISRGLHFHESDAVAGTHPPVEQKIKCCLDGRAAQASLFEREKPARRASSSAARDHRGIQRDSAGSGRMDGPCGCLRPDSSLNFEQDREARCPLESHKYSRAGRHAPGNIQKYFSLHLAIAGFAARHFRPISRSAAITPAPCMMALARFWPWAITCRCTSVRCPRRLRRPARL